MDNQQAQLILAVYRPNGRDAADPFFADALVQAESDPTLKDWFAEDQRFSRRGADAVATIVAPREGKALIATSMVAGSRRRRRLLWPLAVAASIMVLLATTFGVIHARRTTARELASLQDLAIDLSEHHASLGLISPDYARLREWVAQKGAPLPNALPPGLAQMGMLGCQVWDTARGKVSLLCFIGADQKMVHLYVFEYPKNDTGLPSIDHPRIEQRGSWSLALWHEPGRACVLGEMIDLKAPQPIARFFRA